MADKQIDFLMTCHMFIAFLWAGRLVMQLLLLSLIPSDSSPVVWKTAASRNKTIYYFLGLPGMILSVTLGLTLAWALGVDIRYEHWIIWKIFFVGFICTVDLVLGWEIRGMARPDYRKSPHLFPVLLGTASLSAGVVLYLVFEKPF